MFTGRGVLMKTKKGDLCIRFGALEQICLQWHNCLVALSRGILAESEILDEALKSQGQVER